MSTFSFKKAIDSGAGARKVVPADEYRVEVEDAKPKPTKAGDDGILVRLRIKAGTESGNAVFIQYTFSDKAIWKFFQDAPAYGLTEEYLATDPSLEEVCERMTGKRLLAAVTVGEYRNAPSNNVDSLRVDETAGVASDGPSPSEAAPSDGPPKPDLGDDEEPF